MDPQQTRNSVKDSFLYPQRQQNKILKFLKKFDFFSFIPVPKDQPVSTKRSIIGSVLFIILFLIYITVDLIQFIMDNPPLVQNAQSMLDDQFYTLPKIAITFMQGQSLNITKDYSRYITYTLTKQLKDNSIKLSTDVEMTLNNYTYMKQWLSDSTVGFYKRLLVPSEEMQARGLLYSTQNANYTKITINLCDLNDVDVQCEEFQNISSLMAKGRIFLFMEETPDDSGISRQSSRPNKFRIANFYLIPHLYKRVTIEFQVIKTTVLPDYFHHFTTRNFTRLQLYSITQQTSDTSINDKQQGRQSLQMLGITFQLAAQALDVRVVYVTFLDHVAKWGAFFNVLFAIFAIFFLAYNKDKFYKKNPDWDRFKNRKKSDNIIYTQTQSLKQDRRKFAQE